MFLCEECGELFEEPVQKVYSHHSEVEYNCNEFFSACPKCGSDNYFSAVKCCECRQEINEELDSLYVRFDNGDLVCNDCLHDYCKERYGFQWLKNLKMA